MGSFSQTKVSVIFWFGIRRVDEDSPEFQSLMVTLRTSCEWEMLCLYIQSFCSFIL